MTNKFCDSIISYKRVEAQSVSVGSQTIGGKTPIKLQSMTTTDTNNVEATVAQSKRIFDAGADLVRITAQGVKEAEKLKEIKEQLVASGYTKPLVADIHFNPKAALVAAQYVEKVRINPGNYVDSKRFRQLEYTDDEYIAELEKIRLNLRPLLDVCKKNKTAIRIGANHGSLSDRIMSRYGDTPMGLVMSLVEFLRICKEEDFFDLVLSIKASNTRIMVQSCRLLVSMMREEGFVCPLHLGVTEAGEGEDGRIKSAVGIGALLLDGIGDTIRVSLTEDPECEIPVAKAIAEHCAKNETEGDQSALSYQVDPFLYKRRETKKVNSIGGASVPVVLADARSEKTSQFETDYMIVDRFDKSLPSIINQIVPLSGWDSSVSGLSFPLLMFDEFVEKGCVHPELNFIEADADQLDNMDVSVFDADNVVLILKTASGNFRNQRQFIFKLIEQNIKTPVVVTRSYAGTISDLQIKAACDFGSLLIDGLVDGLMISAEDEDSAKTADLSFALLQATRLRMSKTEYISCPSCGRTLFDIQDVVKIVKEKTSHLKSLKIAVMGCIVNGPGEMADADYGYVGSGPGKVSLYKAQEQVKRNIASDEAVDVLIDMIKENGDWLDA